MEHQSDNAQGIERTNNDDSFEIFKPKILMVINKIKRKKNVHTSMLSTLFMIS